jgi:hypothetical protein
MGNYLLIPLQRVPQMSGESSPPYNPSRIVPEKQAFQKLEFQGVQTMWFRTAETGRDHQTESGT